MKRKNIKCGLVYLLCAALMFESTGVTTLAEEAQTVVVEKQEVSGNVATEDAIEVLSGTGDATDSIASGTYYGMDWNISGDGLLTISGEYDETNEGTSWYGQREHIKGVKVTATNVKSTKEWFFDCYNLVSADFNEFDTSQVTDMSGMFCNCILLTNLDISNFDMSKVENAEDMLLAGYMETMSITSLKTPENVKINVALPGTFKDAEETVYVYLPQNKTESVALEKLDNNIQCSRDDQGKVTISGIGALTEESLRDVNFDWSLVNEIVIEEGILRIEEYLFLRLECDSLVSVTIPEGVTQIEYATFWGCSELQTVNLPSTLTAIGELAFASCDSLTSITIPEGVTHIESEAFSWCYGLQTVTLPSTLKNIGDSAFDWCSSLENITLPEGLEYIASNSFYNTGLTSVTIPESVLVVEKNAFTSCESIKSVYILGCETEIESEAFAYCNNIETATGYLSDTLAWELKDATLTITGSGEIPGGYSYNSPWEILNINDKIENLVFNGAITAIGGYTFQNCTSLSSLTLPESLTSIGSYAFKNCSNLKELYIPDIAIEGGYNRFEGCNIEKASGKLNDAISWEYSNEELKVLGTGAIPDYTDDKYNYDNFPQWNEIGLNIQTLIIDKGITRVGNSAFKGSSVASVNFPDSVTAIGAYAFFDCDSLREVTLSKNIANIEEGAFDNCEGIENASGFLTENISWKYEKGALEISGEGKIPDYEDIEERIPVGENWYEVIRTTVLPQWYFVGLSDKVESLSIGEGITEIGYRTFYDTENLKEVTLPNSLTNIETFAFWDCSSLLSVDIPSQVTTIGSFAFCGCSSMVSVNIPNSVTTIEYDAFTDCLNLEKIVLPNSITYIDQNTFNNCEKLSEVIIPNSVICIDGWAFRDCKSLRTVDIPNSMERIMDGAFKGCSALEEMTLLQSVLALGDTCFQNCTSLEKIVIPASVTYIGENCFSGCPNVVLHVYSESTALTYAIENNLEYILLDGEGGGENDDGGNTDTTDGDDNGDTDTTDGDDNPNDTTEDFVVSAVSDQIYTGKAIKPSVKVKQNGKLLVAGRDYTVTYKNNTNAATVEAIKAPTITVKGKGNYAGTISVKFNILPQELTAENTNFTEMIVAANGKEQKAKTTVRFGSRKLSANKDYTIEYPDKSAGAYKEAGVYNVIIKGTGNYQGKVEATMTILGDNQVMASKLKVSKIVACTYVEGTPATPSVTVSYKGKELEFGKDYTVSYANNDRAGKATVIITGLKNAEGTYVAGSVAKSFTIKGTALKKASVTFDNMAVYTSAEICPAVTLKMGTSTLRPGKDYTVTYTKNVNVGKGTIILTGCGGFTGTVKKTFTIQADSTVANKLSVTFTDGKAEAAYNQKGAKPEINVTLDSVKLVAGKDYTVSYKNNKKLAAANADKAPLVVIKGKGNYKFTKEVSFAIVEKALSDEDMEVAAADRFVGEKKSLLSAPVIKDANGKKLKVNKDYAIVGYTVNGAAFDGTGEVAAGTTITVTVEGKGNYIGTATATYRVASKNISKTKVNKPKLEYNGGTVVFTEKQLAEGAFVITDKATSQNLVYGKDYIVTGYKNNTKKGTATVTIQGMGEYGGTKNVKLGHKQI